MNNKKKIVNGIVFPLLAALIWGASFPMQSICIKHMTAFWINGTRSLLACLVLFCVCAFLKKTKGKDLGKIKDLIMGSLSCGVCLFLAVNLQQIGMIETDSGKAGFITALYMVLVPIFSLFIGKKAGIKTWISVALAVAGLFFLCIKDDLSIESSDLLVMVCAVFFALQIMAIDHYSEKVDGIALSCGQFLVTGILSMIVAFIFEDFASQDFVGGLPSLLYIALLSSCIAYTLQILSFDGGDPTILSLLFSTEAVFAVIAGVIILNETLSQREVLGCALMFLAVIFVEIPVGKMKGVKLIRRGVSRLRRSNS